MATNNITTSILSISSPGTCISASAAEDVKITRRANDDLAAVCRQHPAKFRFFASLPLTSITDALKEIDRALDELKATGFLLLSNTKGVYLGDKILDPVFEKLNERNAIVFMHPSSCHVGAGSAEGAQLVNPQPQYPRPMMEFMFDETRAVSNLLLSGTVSRFPNVKFIMSHCGCVLPSILDRVGAFSALVHGKADSGEEFMEVLRKRFWFDLAGVPFPSQIGGLLSVLGEGGEKRLLYGSDFPFTPLKATVTLRERMAMGFKGLGWNNNTVKDVCMGNATSLLGS